MRIVLITISSLLCKIHYITFTI